MYTIRAFTTTKELLIHKLIYDTCFMWHQYDWQPKFLISIYFIRGCQLWEKTISYLYRAINLWVLNIPTGIECATDFLHYIHKNIVSSVWVCSCCAQNTFYNPCWTLASRTQCTWLSLLYQKIQFSKTFHEAPDQGLEVFLIHTFWVGVWRGTFSSDGGFV